MKTRGIILFTVLFIAGAAQALFAEEFEKARALINEKKYSEAIELLKAMPDSQRRSLHLGIAYAQSDKTDEAKECLLAALKENAGLVPASYTLAMIYEKEKSYDKAYEQWQNVYLNAKSRDLKELARRHIELLKTEIK